MPLLKPFRALRYDTRAAGSLDDLVAPPHDVISPEQRARLLAASPYNAVRLILPDRAEDAARALAEWRSEGILVREERPAVWFLEEDFVAPDGVGRTRRSIVARVRLEPYSAGIILPHERTFPRSRSTRLELVRATRTKLSPVLLLHEGESPTRPGRPPDLEATLEGVRSRMWRLDDADSITKAIASVDGTLIIADGHHRYETALRFHEEDGSEETAYVLAALVSRRDDESLIFPTHRIAEAAPELNGRFRVTAVEGDTAQALDRLARVPRDHPAFVVLRADGAVLAEADPDRPGPVGELDTTAIDTLPLEGVSFTPSAAEAERAVRSGRAQAAFLVRAPTIGQVEAAALAGERMPQKSTYFFPKLTSGLVFSPLDE